MHTYYVGICRCINIVNVFTFFELHISIYLDIYIYIYTYWIYLYVYTCKRNGIFCMIKNQIDKR